MRRLLVSVLVVFVYGCDEQSPTNPSQLAVTFSGRLREFATDTAIAGAAIEFREDSGRGAQATTDAAGVYRITVPGLVRYEVFVDGVRVGSSQVTWPTYRADLYARGSTCISRYGTLADARTRRPIGGATVSLTGQSVTTQADGWYRIDLGCPAMPVFGGTTLIYFSHPDYQPGQTVVGRGVQGVSRLDFVLERQ